MGICVCLSIVDNDIIIWLILLSKQPAYLTFVKCAPGKTKQIVSTIKYTQCKLTTLTLNSKTSKKQPIYIKV